MGTTTTNMGLSKPTLAGDSSTWDDQLNASLDLIDTHNHTTGAGVQIPAGGLNLTTDLTLNGTCALTNAKALAFTTQASYTVSKSLWVKTSDGELYWRNASGTDVKMTSGGTLNISIVGGILGDYAASAAAVYYDDSAQAYRFLEAAPSPNSWSRVQCGDLDLYEHASGIANRVRIASPTGLAASYALTLPAALPGSTSLLQVSSAGAITASNTVANAATFSALTTHSNGITVTTGAANLNGAASISLPTRKLVLSAGLGYVYSGAATLASGAFSGGAAGTAHIPIPLHEGDRINKIVVSLKRGAGTLTFNLKRLQYATLSTVAGSGTLTVASGTTDTTGTIDNGAGGNIAHTIAANYSYVMEAAIGDAGDRVYQISVEYDRP